MSAPVAAQVMKPPTDKGIELLLILSPAQFERFGPELDQLRRKLKAPSNTQAVIEAVRHANAAG